MRDGGGDASLLNSDAAWDFDHGTLNGVYAFLEECGCRWCFPGEKGEVVPEHRSLSVNCFEQIAEPAFALRVFGQTNWRMPAERHVPIQDLLKKEVKELGIDWRSNRLWLLRVRASSEWFAFNHRPPRTQWEQRFGKTHPEYFAVLPDGTRDLKNNTSRMHTGHLCYSEPGVFDETVADISAYFSGATAESRGLKMRVGSATVFNRGWAPNACYGDTVSMLPNDGFRGCHCSACMAKTDTEGPRWQTHSRLVWPFVSSVSTEIQKRFPDKLIICLAYSSYTEIPADLELPNNLIVGVCPYLLNKTYNIVDSKSYGELFELVVRLGSANDMPLLFWFHHLYRLGTRQVNAYGVPMLLPHFFKRLIGDLSAHGRLFFMEMDHDSIMFEHLNRYVVMRLLFEPEADVDSLIADYVSSLYGPAAADISRILSIVEKNSEQIASTAARRNEIWRTIYSDETMGTISEAMAHAVVVTRGTAYAGAVNVFATYVVGLIQDGRQRYIQQFSDPAKKKAARISVLHCTDDVRIDGNLNEPCWAQAESRPLLDNVTGKQTQWPGRVAVMVGSDQIYCAFTCTDPRLADTPGSAIPREDYVEVFLDPDPKDEVYYQILVYPGGKVLDFQCNNRTRKNDASWASHVTFAHSVDSARGQWVLELAIPIASTGGKPGDVKGKLWGANFCRTIMDPPRPSDQFSSSSPYMRGSFRQPGLFGTLSF